MGGESDAIADEDDVCEVLLLEELQPRLGEGRRQRRGSGERGTGRAEGHLQEGRFSQFSKVFKMGDSLSNSF